MEPCAHHGHDAAVHRARRSPPASRGSSPASRDPNPEAAGGLERLREARRRASSSRPCEARAPERGVADVGRARPAVRHLQGRRSRSTAGSTVPGARWVTGEESRRLVHELRAASDAVAVGMGTVRADAPRLDARDVADAARPAAPARVRPRPAARRARSSSCAAGPLDGGARARSRAEGVQSLLLEGGPTLAGAFLEADLVDKLLVFVAPVARRRRARRSSAALRIPAHALAAGRAAGRRGRLLEAYVHEP